MGSLMNQVSLKGLLYISINKVRIAGYEYKWEKKIIKRYLYGGLNE